MLEFLHITRQPPSPEFLAEVVERYACTIPYENISKLTRYEAGLTEIPDQQEFLKLLHQGFGGTCYTVNFHLCNLLRDLDFDASLVLGTSDASVRDHAGLRVRLQGKCYGIDAGFMFPSAGPFLVSGEPITIPSGNRTYRFVPHANETDFSLEVIKDGEVRRSFQASQDAIIEDFAPYIRASFEPEKMFMQTLVIAKKYASAYKTIWGTQFGKVSTSGDENSSYNSIEELEKILATEFEITGYPLRQAIAVVERHSGKPFFT